MDVDVITPHGFCAGVTGALRKALSLAPSGERVYCLHELVHNELVVSDLEARGFVFVEDVADVPAGATVLFSAHGVSPRVRALAAARGLRVVDATCPFVARVHTAARGYAARGLDVVIVGKSSHAEVRGIAGEVEAAGGSWRCVSSLSDVDALPADGGRVGVVSQTTMNADDVRNLVEALKRRFRVDSVAEVCLATKVRQDAVKNYAGEAVLVLGSANSSNTRRLCEVARVPSFRAGTMEELRALDFSRFSRVGVTSGASTPESFFRDAVAFLESGGKTGEA